MAKFTVFDLANETDLTVSGCRKRLTGYIKEGLVKVDKETKPFTYECEDEVMQALIDGKNPKEVKKELEEAQKEEEPLLEEEGIFDDEDLEGLDDELDDDDLEEEDSEGATYKVVLNGVTIHTSDEPIPREVAEEKVKEAISEDVELQENNGSWSADIELGDKG